ncbi:MAG: YCF48-related protein [Ignavibacteriae bacterium]|nr:YCF48-related protein [Ignavibacteriota bacterium]
MKKFFAICFIFVFTVIVSETNGQTSPEWKWLHPKPQGQYIEWFKMLDPNNWVGVADYGNFIRTTNAGVNWTTSTGGYPSTLYPGANIYQNFRTAYFLNAMTGYLGVQSVRGIVKTTNGGQSFDTLQILASGSGSTYGIYFLNSLTGYICGTSTFKAQKTTNSGTNWTMLPNLGTSTLYGVYAADTSNIIVGGSTSGKLFKTSNAGTSWDTIYLGVTSTIYQIKFINNTTGYLCGTSGLVRNTTNGGINWTGTNPPTTSSLYNVVVSGTDVYASGTVSTQELYKSTDNGTTWTSISYAGAGQLSTISAYGFDKVGSTMVVAGTYGMIAKSTNSGTNWSMASYQRGLANLTDMYAQNNNGRVIAVGTDPGVADVIMYSGDGGSTWNTANYIATDYINTISMLNANTGFKKLLTAA